jgi:hypothetical protein
VGKAGVARTESRLHPLQTLNISWRLWYCACVTSVGRANKYTWLPAFRDFLTDYILQCFCSSGIRVAFCVKSADVHINHHQTATRPELRHPLRLFSAPTVL